MFTAAKVVNNLNSRVIYTRKDNKNSMEAYLFSAKFLNLIQII